MNGYGGSKVDGASAASPARSVHAAADHGAAVEAEQLGVGEDLVPEEAAGVDAHRGAAPDDGTHLAVDEVGHLLVVGQSLKERRRGEDDAHVLAAQDPLDLVQDVFQISPGLLGPALRDALLGPPRVEVDGERDSAPAVRHGAAYRREYVRAADRQPVHVARNASVVEDLAVPGAQPLVVVGKPGDAFERASRAAALVHVHRNALVPVSARHEIRYADVS